MFDLEDAFVWDFWLAHDDLAHDHWHLFFLQAPRTLGDPDLRHHHASVGHAVSEDLRSWRSLGEAVPIGEAGTFDDLAVWTGSVVRTEGGSWAMFHSGLDRASAGLRQRVGVATSTDLGTWTPSSWTLAADPRWYETLADATWPDERQPHEHWRDPWVVQDDGGLWHMYLTARVRDAAAAPGRGVVGHATSADGWTWEIGPPLSEPTGVFEQLEVIQLACVDGDWVLVFSCLGTEMAGPGASTRPGAGGCWYVDVAGPGAPVDVRGARRLLDERFYVAKLVPLTEGSGWGVMAFRNAAADGRFMGGVTDPMPVERDRSGRLRVVGC